MIKRRIHYIIWVSFLALTALTLLMSSQMSLKAAISANYSKIMVSFMGEDTNSSFETIYLFNKVGKIVNIIQIWNGGCCQAPMVEEFYREGKRFKRSRSYTLEIEKTNDFPKVILCDKSIVKTNIEPTHQAVAGYSVAEIEENYVLEEPIPFTGCQKK
ncbi:hypothetical protein NBRC116602_21420 [Hyphomicrobiales bacterium 4NK60-0047b]|jgi:beta-lactamase regulating signal transducer with metallopeptidase domain